MALPVVITLGNLLVWMNIDEKWIYMKPHSRNQTLKKGEERGRFLYMYNVAQCLPLDLLTNETLLDAAMNDK